MRVVVTRAREAAGPLAERLEELGYDVEVCPLIRVEPLDGPPVSLSGYDLLVLTSARAVEELFRRGVEGELPRIAVVGPGTAAALVANGVEPDVVADESTQDGLLRAIPRPAGHVLFAAAEGARDVLADELAADVVTLYRTVEERPSRFPDADIVVLASASAARAYAALGGHLPCVSIGPITSAEATRCGLTIVAEAGTHDLEGLVQAVRLAESRVESSRS